jgi:UDP-glucose 4-epimerase
MSRVLITGGAGFIGAHLARLLRREGHEITIIDNLKAHGGIPFVSKKDHFVEADVSDYKTFKKLEDKSFDILYHLAAQSAGESAYDDPQYDLMTNGFGTFNALRFAKAVGVKNFIYTSTVAVYGGSAAGETKESAKIDPDSIYGVSKYAGELYCHQLLRDTGISYSIFRIFNAYGPGENLNYMKKGMVSIYSSFIWRKEAMIIKGSLDRYRDFTYIEDVIDVLRKAIDCPKANGQTYNLSSGVKTTVRELISEILDVNNLPSDYELKIEGGTPGDTHGFHADIGSLKRDLDWSPKYTLRDGLRKYFDWINMVPVQGNISDYHPLKLRENGD